MRYEVTIVATNTVLIDADNEDDATQQALALGVFETLDGADYDVTSVVPIRSMRRKTMGKVSDWLIGMEEDAAWMSRDSWAASTVRRICESTTRCRRT